MADVGAEIGEGKADRREGGDERLRERAVLEAYAAFRHREAADVEPQQLVVALFRFLRRRGRRREPRQVQAAVGGDDHLEVGRLQIDRLQNRAALPQRLEQLGVDVQVPERQQRRAVRLGELQVGDVGGERERVEADLADGNLPLQLFADEGFDLRAGDARHEKEADQRIGGQQHRQDSSKLSAPLQTRRSRHRPSGRGKGAHP